jgi:hypothetical protein
VKRLLFAAMLLLPFAAMTQKNVDLDKFRFTAEFRSLPYMMVDSSYHTYNVSVEATRLMQGYLANMDPEQSVYLDGWKHLSKDGHLQVMVKLEDLIPESFSVKERVEVIKDSKGVQTGTRTMYHQEVTYTFNAFAEVNDYKGAHYKSIPLADRQYKQVYSSPEFAIKYMAEGYFLLNSLAITEQLFKNCVTRAMHYLSDQLTENFGYRVATVTDHMWIIDSRKHPEYSNHRNAFLTLKDALFGLSANKPLGNIREQVQPVIDYFESIKKKYTSTSKHDRKIRYASYFNLAVLYYYLDDPQAMLKEASGLILNDYDSRDGKAFETSALRLKKLFEESKIYTRHFAIDTTTFRGPFEKATGVAVNPRGF